MELLHKEITDKIINAFYTVYRSLGYGFLEKVYENAMFIELKKCGLRVIKQQPVEVYYDDCKVGEYYADLLVEDKVIVELKAAEEICEAHEYQLLNYLKATRVEVGLLMNFGRRAHFKRKVFQNINKLLRNGD